MTPPLRLVSLAKKPKELGAPVRGSDRASLAVLCTRYDQEAMSRAVEDIYATRRAAASFKPKVIK